ncbi:MAG: SDR family oxidoreductase [Planctomycetota bacterium]
MNKNIVITGVTRGIGRALADEFVRLGHTVIGCGRARSQIEDLAHRFPAPHDFAVVDVGAAEQVGAWVQRVTQSHGAPDLVINNAALINALAPLWKVPIAEFDQLIDVNIKGVYYVIRAFVPAMIGRRAGVVVNLSSGWGKSTSPQVAPYCASKWAIEGLTQALAQELPHGLAAVALSPGTVNTDMLAVAFGGSGAAHSADPAHWARANASRILALGPRDNGRSLELVA